MQFSSAASGVVQATQIGVLMHGGKLSDSCGIMIMS